MVDYKDRLNEAMKDAGITTSGLAGKLELTYQAVDKVLKGNTKELTASNNSRAALVLNVNTDWLATGKGSKKRGAPLASEDSAKPVGHISPSEVAELVRLYAACNDKGRNVVMAGLRDACLRYGANAATDNKSEMG